MAARGAELLLSPANLAPLASRRNVMVVHDTAPFQDPSWYSSAYGAWHRTLLPRLVRRARLVVAPSEHVVSELAELFEVPPERLRAIAPGVDHAFHAPGDPAPLLRRLGLDRPYVLALGTEGPAKEPCPARPDGPGACRGRLRSGDRGLHKAVPPRLRPRQGAPARVRARGRPSRAAGRRGGVRDALALRGLRPPLRRGDGGRHARRGRGPRVAPGGVRRRGAPGGPARPARLRRRARASRGGGARASGAGGKSACGRSSPGSAPPRSSTAPSSCSWLRPAAGRRPLYRQTPDTVF